MPSGMMTAFASWHAALLELPDCQSSLSYVCLVSRLHSIRPVACRYGWEGEVPTYRFTGHLCLLRMDDDTRQPRLDSRAHTICAANSPRWKINVTSSRAWKNFQETLLMNSEAETQSLQHLLYFLRPPSPVQAEIDTKYDDNLHLIPCSTLSFVAADEQCQTSRPMTL